MKMVMKIVLGIIMITAILAMGATSFAEIKKTPSTMQQNSPAQQTLPEATAAAWNATISGSITVGDQDTGITWNDRNCSDIDVKVTRESETLRTTKATGGKIINGCNYSVSVKRGPGTVVTASCVIVQDVRPIGISGRQGPFDLNANITKNLVMWQPVNPVL